VENPIATGCMSCMQFVDHTSYITNQLTITMDSKVDVESTFNEKAISRKNAFVYSTVLFFHVIGRKLFNFDKKYLRIWFSKDNIIN
jgi:hypothetical protein